MVDLRSTKSADSQESSYHGSPTLSHTTPGRWYEQNQHHFAYLAPRASKVLSLV